MKLRGKVTISALQFKLLSCDSKHKGSLEAPFLVALASKTLGVKIPSYLEKKFTQRLLLSQKIVL